MNRNNRSGNARHPADPSTPSPTKSRVLWLCVAAVLLLSTPLPAQSHFASWGIEVANTSFHEQAFIRIAAGGFHSLALRCDGTTAAWGDNSANALQPFGGDSGQCQDFPPLPPGVSYVEIAAGNMHSLARLSDGALVARGTNLLGQCNVPGLPAGLAYVEIAAGADNSMARLSDGSVDVWGRSGPQSLVPALPAGLRYVEIACGRDSFNFCMARRSDGSVVAWGDNSSLQLNVPVLPARLSFVEIAAGARHGLARLGDGSLVAWGDNSKGQRNIPALPAGVFYVEIAAGPWHNVARRSDGSVVAWGDNGKGQCRVTPPPAGLSYVEIAAGSFHTLARRSDGSVAAFGSNALSQLNAPTHPPGLSYTQITASRVALRSDGQIITWGGVATAPALAPGLSYVEVRTSGGHALARRNDGTVAAWGSNAYGQLNVPPLPPGQSYVELATGRYHSLARLSDGSVVAWGQNSANQCNVPALPPGVTYVQLAAGASNSVACRSDGAIVGWGAGTDLYGLNTPPVLPPNLTYVEVATSGYHTLARRSDGSVVGWGSNFNGQCNAPPLPPGVRYAGIAAASINPMVPPHFAVSAACRSDGALIGWGTNYPYGQNQVPAVPAGYSCVEVSARPGMGCARFELTLVASAPTITRVDPSLIEALNPGRQKSVAISGAGLDLTSDVLLDGTPIDPSRYSILSSTTISLDMPDFASLGVHELAVTDGLRTSRFPLTIVASSQPRHELGNGNAFNSIDRDDGLSYIASGTPGSVHLVLLSRSSVPSLSANVGLDIGYHFSSLTRIGVHVIPASGWIGAHLPSISLPDPGLGGSPFYAQTLELGAATPYRVSNPQSIWMVR